jgi:hypothetical protein
LEASTYWIDLLPRSWEGVAIIINCNTVPDDGMHLCNGFATANALPFWTKQRALFDRDGGLAEFPVGTADAPKFIAVGPDDALVPFSPVETMLPLSIPRSTL